MRFLILPFLKTDFGVLRFSRGHFLKNDPPPFGDHTPYPLPLGGGGLPGGLPGTPLPLLPAPMARGVGGPCLLALAAGGGCGIIVR